MVNFYVSAGVSPSNIQSDTHVGNNFYVPAGVSPAFITTSILKSVTDTVNAGDSIALTAAIAVQDTGATSDTPGPLSASVPVSEAANAQDSINVLREVMRTITETVAALDSIGALSVSPAVADTANAQDTVGAPSVSLSVADTALTQETINVLKAVLRTITESVAVGETATIQPIMLNVTDTGQAADTVTPASVALTLSDTADVSEILEIIRIRLVSVTDTAQVDENIGVSASITVNDTAQATDLISQILNSLSASETVRTFETVVVADFALLPTGKVRIEFKMVVPGVGFAMKIPKANVTIN